MLYPFCPICYSTHTASSYGRSPHIHSSQRRSSIWGVYPVFSRRPLVLHPRPERSDIHHNFNLERRRWYLFNSLIAIATTSLAISCPSLNKSCKHLVFSEIKNLPVHTKT